MRAEKDLAWDAGSGADVRGHGSEASGHSLPERHLVHSQMCLRTHIVASSYEYYTPL